MKILLTQILFPSTVVSRLRFGMLVILALSLGSTFMSVYALGNIQRAHDQLTNESIPTLIASDLLERKLLDILHFSERVGDHSTVEQLDEAQTALAKIAVELQQITTLQADLGTLSQFEYDIQIDTGVLVVLTQDLIDISNDLISKENALKEQQNIILEILENMKQALEIEILNVNERIELAEFSAQPSSSGGDADFSYSEEIDLLFTLTQISAMLDTIRDAVTYELSTHDHHSGHAVIERIKSGYRGIALSLPQLPNSDVRTELADSVGKLQSTTFAEDGLEFAVGIIHSLHREYDVNKSRHVALTNKISRTSQKIVERSKVQIENAAAAAQNQVTYTSNLAFFGAATTFVTALLILFVVVEKQINHRMSSLSRSMRTIAKGNTDHDVEVVGKDELGQMAIALDIFKHNSRSLQKSNEELERFSFIASHDLKSPLRGIHELTQWTLDDSGDLLPGKSRQNLKTILTRISRLDKILDNLLEYSQIGKSTTTLQPPNRFDFSAVVTEAFEQLDTAGDFSLQINSGLGSIKSYETPLRQILYTMFNNAVEHHDRDQGLITLTATETETDFDIVISDDGPGIPPHQHDRIFEMIQAPQHGDTAAASGMALSISRKMIEYYGGSISVASDPARTRGTEFHIVWPKMKRVERLDAAA